MEEITGWHNNDQLKARFVRVMPDELEDFVIFEDVGVLHSPALKETFLKAWRGEISFNDAWEKVKESSGMYYRLTSPEGQRLTDYFERFMTRKAIEPKELTSGKAASAGGK